MTDDEANEMLKQLKAHFKCHVMPISRYCGGLDTWAGAMQDRATRLRDELFPGFKEPYDTQAFKDACEEHRRESEVRNRLKEKRTERDYKLEELKNFEATYESINYAFMRIKKSCLLDRLLYGGEKLRSKMCPVHKGTWSGIECGPSNDGTFQGNVCPHGCQLTGWIPEPEDQPSRLHNAPVAVTIDGTGTVTASVTGEMLGILKQPEADRHATILLDPNPLERK